MQSPKKFLGGLKLRISTIFQKNTFFIVSSQANIRNQYFDQKSKHHPEVGVFFLGRGGVSKPHVLKCPKKEHTFYLENKIIREYEKNLMTWTMHILQGMQAMALRTF